VKLFYPISQHPCCDIPTMLSYARLGGTI